MYIFNAKFGFLVTPGLLPDLDGLAYATVAAKNGGDPGAYATYGHYVTGAGYNYETIGFLICDEIPAIGGQVDFVAFEAETNPLTLEDLPGRCFLATGRLLEVENCIGEAASLESYIAWRDDGVGAGGEDDGVDLGGMITSLVARQKANIELVKATLSPAQALGFEAGIASLSTGRNEKVEEAVAPLNATEKEGFVAALDFLQNALEAEEQAKDDMDDMDDMMDSDEYARESAIIAQGDRMRVWHYLRHENLNPETDWAVLVPRFGLDIRLLAWLPGNRARLGFFTDQSEFGEMVFELALGVKPKFPGKLSESNWDIAS